MCELLSKASDDEQAFTGAASLLQKTTRGLGWIEKHADDTLFVRIRSPQHLQLILR